MGGDAEDESKLLLSPPSGGIVVILVVVGRRVSVGAGVGIRVPAGGAASGGGVGGCGESEVRVGIGVRVWVFLLFLLLLESEATFLEVEERRAALLLPPLRLYMVVGAHFFRTDAPPPRFLSPLSLLSLAFSFSLFNCPSKNRGWEAIF